MTDETNLVLGKLLDAHMGGTEYTPPEVLAYWTAFQGAYVNLVRYQIFSKGSTLELRIRRIDGKGHYMIAVAYVSPLDPFCDLAMYSFWCSDDFPPGKREYLREYVNDLNQKGTFDQ